MPLCRFNHNKIRFLVERETSHLHLFAKQKHNATTGREAASKLTDKARLRGRLAVTYHFCPYLFTFRENIKNTPASKVSYVWLRQHHVELSIGADRPCKDDLIVANTPILRLIPSS